MRTSRVKRNRRNHSVRLKPGLHTGLNRPSRKQHQPRQLARKKKSPSLHFLPTPARIVPTAAYPPATMRRLSLPSPPRPDGHLARPGRAGDGEAIYAEHCASCHGKNGEGVPDEVDEPLHGERALPSLARYIDRKMPEDKPELLDAEESQRVAEYIYGAFYSAEARAKTTPTPKPAFARLTNRQFRESVADLLGSFGKHRRPARARGLKARVLRLRRHEQEGAARPSSARTAQLAFDFGEGPPGRGHADRPVLHRLGRLAARAQPPAGMNSDRHPERRAPLPQRRLRRTATATAATTAARNASPR